MSSRHDETRYLILARADFDADGAEDLLVRADWRSLESTGAGHDLFLLTRPSRRAPLQVAWRAPMPIAASGNP